MKRFLLALGDAFYRMYTFGPTANPMPRWLQIGYSLGGWFATGVVIYGFYKGLTV